MKYFVPIVMTLLSMVIGCTHTSQNEVKGDHVLVPGHYDQKGEWIPELRYKAIHDIIRDDNGVDQVISDRFVIDTENMNYQVLTPVATSGDGINKHIFSGFGGAVAHATGFAVGQRWLRPQYQVDINDQSDQSVNNGNSNDVASGSQSETGAVTNSSSAKGGAAQSDNNSKGSTANGGEGGKGGSSSAGASADAKGGKGGNSNATGGKGGNSDSTSGARADAEGGNSKASGGNAKGGSGYGGEGGNGGTGNGYGGTGSGYGGTGNGGTSNSSSGSEANTNTGGGHHR